MFNDGLAAGEFGGDEALVGLEYGERVGRAVLLNIFQDASNSVGRQGTVNDAQFEKLAREELDLFLPEAMAGS